MAVLKDMARWARSVTPADLPADIRTRARLQQLSTAGAVRTGSDAELVAAFGGATRKRKGMVTLITGTRMEPRDAAGALAALSGAREYDDFLLGAHPNHGAVAAAWAAAEGHSLDELCTAAVVATEITGRIGLAHLFSPAVCSQGTWATRVSTAVAVGWLRGLTAEQLADAMALALGQGASVDFDTLLAGNQRRGEAIGEAAQAGWDAVEAALGGSSGNVDLLDGNGLPGLPHFRHLPAAYAGLGKRWLMRTLSYKLCPGDPWLQTTYQSFEELLRRHMKAASKRLRVDQLHGVEVHVDLPTWVRHRMACARDTVDSGSCPYRIDYAVAAMLTAYEGGPVLTDDAWLAENQDTIRELAEKVLVVHDWSATMTLAETFAHTLGALVSDIHLREWPELGQEVREHYAAFDPGLDLQAILAILAGRPDRLHAALRDAVGKDLADIDLDAFHVARPAHLKMFTIRGGWWPERRDVVEGGPEYPLDFLASDVVDKFARGRGYTAPDRPGEGDGYKPLGEQFLALPGTHDAVEALGILAG